MQSYSHVDGLASELLQSALDVKEIRTEVFCQVIKQLTQNPSGQSEQKGRDLLILCLYTFPPPPDFENYCEMYLRSLPNKDKYVGTLHDTLYSPERRQAPQESEFAHILREADNPNRSPSFAAPLPHAQMQQQQQQQQMFQPHAPKPYATVLPSLNNQPTYANSQPAYAPPPPAGPPPPAVSAAAVVEDTNEWHYIDKSGGQHGPSRGREIKDGWLNGSVDGECIAWNPNLEGWSKISTLPDFLQYLNA